MNIKEILDKIYYDRYKGMQQDFWLAGLTKVDGEIKARKWKLYSEVVMDINPNESWKINWVNQRQIFPNEVVLDLEEKELLEPSIKKLDTLGWSYEVFSAGRGYHIHVWFTKKFTPDKKLEIIKSFKADEQKAGQKCTISLENVPHWKSNKVKTLIKSNRIRTE